MNDSFARPNFNKSCMKCQTFDSYIMHYASSSYHVSFFYTHVNYQRRTCRNKNHRHATSVIHDNLA